MHCVYTTKHLSCPVVLLLISIIWPPSSGGSRDPPSQPGHGREIKRSLPDGICSVPAPHAQSHTGGHKFKVIWTFYPYLWGVFQVDWHLHTHTRTHARTHTQFRVFVGDYQEHYSKAREWPLCVKHMHVYQEHPPDHFVHFLDCTRCSSSST